MSIFDKFANGINMEDINKGIQEAKEHGGGDYKVVPDGKYEVTIDKMELTQTKSGADKFSAWCTILDGEYKGCKIFKGQPLTKEWMLMKVFEFLLDLGTGIQPTEKIENMVQLQAYIDDVFEEIESKGLEYEVEYKINKNGFGNVEKVIEVLY